MFLGLRTTIYPAPDLAARKAWFTEALGVEPYFDEPFYVGFAVAGYEIGLDPQAEAAVTYWGVADVDVALARLTASGARERTAVAEVGGGIRVATVVLPGDDGAVLGVVENPHFVAADPPATAQAGSGPGR